MEKKSNKKVGEKSLTSKIVRGLWIAFLAGILLLPIFVFSVSINLFNLYGGLPSYRSLENPETDLSSELISSDGVVLGRYFRFNRSPVPYDSISPALINTLIATEDIRYWDHSGIDPIAIARAGFGVLKYTVTFGNASLDGGGSTITQQLAKNLFKTRSEQTKGLLSDVKYLSMVIIKVKEWLVAVELESNYTKQEILAMYLNTVDFGSNAYGIKAASSTFFGKTPYELNHQEAAVLVGLQKAVTYYNPFYNPENSLRRRNVVLNQLAKYDFLDKVVVDSLKSSPIELSYEVENQNTGLAPYFRKIMSDILTVWGKENGYDVWADGLKVYTTVDSRMQIAAEKAMNTQMAELQKTFDAHWKGRNPWIDNDGREIKDFIETASRRTDRYRGLVRKYGAGHDSINIVMNTPVRMKIFTWQGEIDTLLSPIDSVHHFKRFLQGGFMAMKPQNGHIKAWVGGINHKYFKYDHVKQGKRQPGSTFKPFVYATAIENGYSPCFEVVDAPVTFDLPGQNPPSWTPPNSDGVYSGRTMTIRQAMARSINSITAYMMKQVGPENVVALAKRLGVESNLEAVPSLALGVNDVSLFELVGAYSTFANGGVWTEPIFITRIEDKNGNLIQEFVPRTREAMSEEIAYLMLHMLKGAVEEDGGTGAGIPLDLKIDNEIGAKTGTTNNGSDGWFMGVTKDLVAGAWVGGDEPVIRFRNWLMGQGARTARPIWVNFFTEVYSNPLLGVERGPFQAPVKQLSVEIDCNQYKSRGRQMEYLNFNQYGGGGDDN